MKTLSVDNNEFREVQEARFCPRLHFIFIFLFLNTFYFWGNFGLLGLHPILYSLGLLYYISLFFLKERII